MRAVVLLSGIRVFGDTSKSDDNSSSRAFFICITFKLIPDVYGERDVGKERNRIMGNVETLQSIARFLDLKNIETELAQIKEKSNDSAELILPLVGEFSAGKTTLINALTDCKKLETATQPTTATIYEIHFGCDQSYAIVLTSNGERKKVDDIASLKNETLGDAVVVNIFDTSKKVSASTILVDTPGLSSPNPLHRQTLVDFLPQADAILLVTDVNQQITRSLTDFIKTMKLAKRPIFLVITKCDTKSESELEAVKKYISENCELSVEQVACVLASTDNLNELYNLLDKIQKDKTAILKEVNKHRIQTISNTLVQRIDELLKASSSDKDLDNAIRQQEYELNKLNRNIDKLVESATDDINEQGRKISRKFEDIVSGKLETLIAGKSNNFDGEAISAINNTSSLLLNEFKDEIQEILTQKARDRKGTEESISLHSLEEMDISNLSISNISYNLDLNSLGHQYDSIISTGVKVVGVAAAVAGAAVYAAPLVGEMGTAMAIDTAANIADTATDVGSIVSNRKTVGRIERAMNIAERAGVQYNKIDNFNQQAGQQVGCSKGIVESLVGFVTDKTMGKPQRRRAIHNYMDETLSPQFKQEMQRLSKQLSNSIRNALQQEAKTMIEQKTASLEKLKVEKQEKKVQYEQRISQLRDYKNQILTL